LKKKENRIMASFVTLEREEYDDLIRDASQLAEMMTTLDLILDALKGHIGIDKGEAYLETFVDIEEIGDILQYRHPQEWKELVRRVREEQKDAER
jgi:aspartate carbamoyltransferase catalytic subunit